MPTDRHRGTRTCRRLQSLGTRCTVMAAGGDDVGELAGSKNSAPPSAATVERTSTTMMRRPQRSCITSAGCRARTGTTRRLTYAKAAAGEPGGRCVGHRRIAHYLTSASRCHYDCCFVDLAASARAAPLDGARRLPPRVFATTADRQMAFARISTSAPTASRAVGEMAMYRSSPAAPGYFRRDI